MGLFLKMFSYFYGVRHCKEFLVSLRNMNYLKYVFVVYIFCLGTVFVLSSFCDKESILKIVFLKKKGKLLFYEKLESELESLEFKNSLFFRIRS